MGTEGRDGMSLGKNEVIGGKLDPEGERKDCDFVDGGLPDLCLVSSPEALGSAGDFTLPERLACDCPR